MYKNINIYFFRFFFHSGLNFADFMQCQGQYPSPRKPPFIPGLECAGTVEELGEGVTDLEVSCLTDLIPNLLLQPCSVTRDQ